MLKFSGGCRRILVSFAVVLLIVSLIQIWLFRAGAVRELHENQTRNDRNALLAKKEDEQQQELLQKRYFRGRSFALNNTKNGSEDSKRKIPSCPDPLHN